MRPVDPGGSAGATSPAGPAKRALADLAILGGDPAFDHEVYVGRPNIPNRERLLQRFREVLDRGWLSNAGPCVQELERRLEEMLGVKHCICMCNGTVALEIAIRAAGLTGEVILPSFTFVATAHALQWQQITPVFCDIDPDTHTLDPEQIERLITPRTTGIIGVHLWGQACDVAGLQQVADKHGLRLLFDAAHAFGSSYGGRPIGSNGDAEVFSFHATKFFNTIEGGAVTTDNDELANELTLMKNFGFTAYDTVEYIGTNGKMNEICAAMGLAGLEELDANVATNKRRHAAYADGLAGTPGLQVHAMDRDHGNYQYVVTIVDEQAAGLSRDALVGVLHAERVLARRYFYPGCHRMEPYRSYFPNAGLLLPNTEAVAQQIMVLPTGPAVDDDDVALICQIIRFTLQNAADVRKRLPDADLMREPMYGSVEVQRPRIGRHP